MSTVRIIPSPAVALVERLASQTLPAGLPPSGTARTQLLTFAQAVAQHAAEIAADTWEADVGTSDGDSGFPQYGAHSAAAIRRAFGLPSE